MRDRLLERSDHLVFEKPENGKEGKSDYTRRDPTTVLAGPQLRTSAAGACVERSVRAVVTGNGLPQIVWSVRSIELNRKILRVYA